MVMAWCKSASVCCVPGRILAAGTLERREWATFVSPRDGRIYQLYWWQRLGRYVLGRYDEDARLELLGQFFERDEAIAAGLGG